MKKFIYAKLKSHYLDEYYHEAVARDDFKDSQCVSNGTLTWKIVHVRAAKGGDCGL